MRIPPAASSFDSDTPFKYVGGDPSVDLVNTVDWTGTGLENDRLSDYSRLTAWAEGAGLLGPQEAKRLRRRAAAKPGDAESALRGGLWLRWVLQLLFASVARGEPGERALREFNELLSETMRHVQLREDPASDGLLWDWRRGDRRLDGFLWSVVWSAGRLLTGNEARYIRMCGGPDCGWFFVDRSRNRRRRWCQMETCGTRAKSRRRRRKRSTREF